MNEIKLARMTVTWFRERKMIGHWLRWREFVVECKQNGIRVEDKDIHTLGRAEYRGLCDKE